MPKAGPDKQLCGAQRPNQPKGTLCTQRAGWGTSHPGHGPCKRHGGATASHVKAAEIEMVSQAVAKLNLKVETTAAEALLNEIYRTVGNLEFYDELTAALPTHPDPDVYVPDVDEDGEPTGGGHWERGQPGIYGRTYHVSGVPTGEAKPHVLMQMQFEERKHLRGLTVDALRVGIAEEMVTLARDQAELVATVCRQFAVALGHDPADPKVREAFRAQLTLIAGGRAT